MRRSRSLSTESAEASALRLRLASKGKKALARASCHFSLTLIANLERHWIASNRI
jgi:hypothetical protein